MNNWFPITSLPSSSYIIGRLMVFYHKPNVPLKYLISPPEVASAYHVELRRYMIYLTSIARCGSHQNWFRTKALIACTFPIWKDGMLPPKFRHQGDSPSEYIRVTLFASYFPLFRAYYGFGKFHYLLNHMSALLFLCWFPCLWSLDTILAFHAFIDSSHIDFT